MLSETIVSENTLPCRYGNITTQIIERKKEVVDATTDKRKVVTEIIKSEKTYKKVPKIVIERRKWAKFGAAVNGMSYTEIAPEVFIEPVGRDIQTFTDINTNVSKGSVSWVNKVINTQSDKKLSVNDVNNVRSTISTYAEAFKNKVEETDPESERTLFVSNIPQDAEYDDFVDIIRQAVGKDVCSIKLIKGRCIGFVTVTTKKLLPEVINRLNRLHFDHSLLSVQKASKTRR